MLKPAPRSDRPIGSRPTIVFFVTADSIDGNGETVHRAFASITKTVGGTLESQRIFPTT